jgi:anti-sigma factor RsiW
MTCREFIEFLTAYLGGELPPERRALFEEHLAECPWCVAYVQNYRETIRLGKAAFDPSDERLPERVPDELVQAILAARARKK